jgi:biopolymer transport protein TolQ
MQELLGGILPAPAAVHDFSMLGLFLQADLIVKGVIVLLVGASVVCWAIILDKVLRVLALRREVRRLERVATDERPGDAARGGLTSLVLAAGRREEPEAGESRAEYRARLERAMRAAVSAELRRIEPGLPFLATVGSAAPFVGLFGTVWGIMNSFTAIAQSNDTSLAVVAPGIAEALLATAMGLAAAIPAVVAYNKLAVAMGRAAQRLHAAVGAISNAHAREIAAATAAHGRQAAAG